ncbi:hypothetical protein J3E68DRAFT_397912, partial [Trichoderma sp. SZMC 28012]
VGMYLPGPCRQHGACYGAYLPELGIGRSFEGHSKWLWATSLVQVSPDEYCLSYLYQTLLRCWRFLQQREPVGTYPVSPSQVQIQHARLRRHGVLWLHSLVAI